MLRTEPGSKGCKKMHGALGGESEKPASGSDAPQESFPRASVAIKGGRAVGHRLVQDSREAG